MIAQIVFHYPGKGVIQNGREGNEMRHKESTGISLFY